MFTKNILASLVIDKSLEREVLITFHPCSWFRVRYHRFQEGNYTGSNGIFHPWGKVVRVLSVRLGSHVVHLGR